MSERDWTQDESGASNASDRFLALSAEVAWLIRESATALLHGRSEEVGRLIVAHLAHNHKVAPPKGGEQELAAKAAPQGKTK